MDAGSAASATGAIGALLRGARSRGGVSQLALSLETRVSQRHISCIESGRSVPGRQTLLLLASALGVPLREQNDWLLAAGYAPVHGADALDAPALGPVRDALARLLQQQQPFPALVLDRWWDVVLANEAAPRFFSRFVDLSRWPRPRNLIRLVSDPDGLRPFVVDWPTLAASLAERVRREAVCGMLDARTEQLLGLLGPMSGATGESGPTVPLVLERDGARFAFFSLVTTVGTPRSVTAQELRVESLFPADADTERTYHALRDAEPPG